MSFFFRLPVYRLEKTIQEERIGPEVMLTSIDEVDSLMLAPREVYGEAHSII